MVLFFVIVGVDAIVIVLFPLSDSDESLPKTYIPVVFFDFNCLCCTSFFVEGPQESYCIFD